VVKELTRRKMLTSSSWIAGSVAAGVPFLTQPGLGENAEDSRKKKIVVVGAHPDDPESGCGGTIARYSNLGHEVVILYLTRGEAGIAGKSAHEAAEIRTAEAQKACSLLKARAVFAGQIDGSTELNAARYDSFRQLLEAEQPEVLFTHWPVDSHRDHRAASLLAYDAWLKAGKRMGLFYYEVETGTQTQNFHPTHYVDISGTEARKRAACLAHASQLPESSFYPLHEKMGQFRGIESGCRVAEAFVQHVQSPGAGIPGLSLDTAR
jgi:N-acetylglucosamine malate deacetylase 1